MKMKTINPIEWLEALSKDDLLQQKEVIEQQIRTLANQRDLLVKEWLIVNAEHWKGDRLRVKWPYPYAARGVEAIEIIAYPKLMLNNEGKYEVAYPYIVLNKDETHPKRGKSSPKPLFQSLLEKCEITIVRHTPRNAREYKYPYQSNNKA